LFDEVEKASESFRRLLLGVFDKAALRCGDNRASDFQNSLIFMSSNIGAKEAVGRGTGYGLNHYAEVGVSVDGVSTAVAKKSLAPEFMNRIDRVIEYKTLSKESIEAILHLELTKVQERVLSLGFKSFPLEYTPGALAELSRQGFSKEYGARELKRVIFRNVQVPVARLVNAGEIPARAKLRINWTEKSGFSHRVIAKSGFFE
jgi:ATP-dependent Clp protease ATP-binding subunit ClpC